MRESERQVRISFYIESIKYDEIDPDALREIAIAALDNPSSTKEEREEALVQAEAFKEFVRQQISKPPGKYDQKAICVDNKGRRTDLKPR